MGEQYWQRPTISLNNLAESAQRVPTSLEARDRRAAWIALQARNVFGSYPRDDFADPDNFVLQLGMVLEGYPDDLIEQATNPRTGIQRKLTKAPSIAHVVKFCNEEMERRERIKRYEAMGKVQLGRERIARTPGRPPGQSYEEMFAKHGRPRGPFEEGRVFPYNPGSSEAE